MKYLLTISVATSIIVAQNVDLDTVVVTATKSKESIKNITADVVVITKEELEAKHVTTVAEALKEAQGVIVSQSGGVGHQSSIFLRGFDSDSTLVLINGVKINNPTLIGGQADIGNLILSDIERIEIIKGPQSGVYGANAVAGVINIITKKATNSCTASTNLEYGSYDTRNIQASIGKKIGNLSIYLGYSDFKTDGFSARADINKDVDDYEDDGYKNQTFNANISYSFTKSDELNLQFTKIKATTDYDMSLTEQEGFTMSEDDKFLSTSFTHRYSKNSYTKIYYNYSKFIKDDPKGWIPKFEGKNKEYGIDNKISFENFEFLFGANRQESKDLINDKTLTSKGVYITGIYKLNNTVFNATLRRDFYSDFEDKTTGKIGLKHSFDNGLTLKANYGSAYRVPSLFEYSLNNQLKPETVKGYDIGFEYKNFTFSYFYNEIEDEILYDMNLWNYTNISGKSKIKGFEIGYKGSISDNLLFSIDYTRYIAHDKDGKQLLRRPSYIINANLDYYGFKNFHLNLNAQYIGKRYDISFDPITFTSKEVQTGKVFVANMAMDYKINKNMSAYVKVDNIFDKKYQDVYGYATSGRAVYVGFNAKF